MTGPAPIFEGDLGFMKLVTREPFDLAPFGGRVRQRRRPFMINKTYIKFWPAEYHSQSAIDAALQLRASRSATCRRSRRSTSTRSRRVTTSSASTRRRGPRRPARRPTTACRTAPPSALLDGDVTLEHVRRRSGSPTRTSCDCSRQGEGPPRRRARRRATRAASRTGSSVTLDGRPAARRRRSSSRAATPATR